ncbi:hypothetical protein SAMN05216419_104714 [Nitrosomonas cryotolerans]|nr:hypothetical protein SAMN05216419_104714 [Nitrosomonas cryotolerans]
MPDTNQQHFKQEQSWIGWATRNISCRRIMLTNRFFDGCPVNQMVNLIQKVSFAGAAYGIKIRRAYNVYSSN